MKYLSRLFTALMAVAGLLFASSCDTEQDPVIPEPDLDLVYDDVAVNRAFEDLDNLTFSLILEEGSLDSRLAQTFDGPICDEAVITVNEAEGIVVIDFGAGCTTNGITRKGKVILTSSRSLELASLIFPGFSVVTTFENYEVNGLKVEGTRTITTQNVDLANFTARVAVTVRDGKITWPDNTFVTYRSDQVREIVLTAGAREVFISGSASGESREGFDYTANISTTVVLTGDCLETGNLTPSSGVIDFQYRGIAVSLDYGFGTCDKTVTITYPGGTKEITLD